MIKSASNTVSPAVGRKCLALAIVFAIALALTKATASGNVAMTSEANTIGAALGFRCYLNETHECDNYEYLSDTKSIHGVEKFCFNSPQIRKSVLKYNPI